MWFHWVTVHSNFGVQEEEICHYFHLFPFYLPGGGFANKGPSGQAMVFPVVMYGCESWTVKKAEHRKIDAFELWC